MPKIPAIERRGFGPGYRRRSIATRAAIADCLSRRKPIGPRPVMLLPGRRQNRAGRAQRQPALVVNIEVNY
jgi:hypothetical protein